MKPRLTVVTLGVDDLPRALAFYRDGLGLETDGIVGEAHAHGAVAFFDLQPGLRLALWPRDSISHDSGLPRDRPSATDLTLGHNVSSRAEVDAVMAQAEAAGATIVKAPHETFWGGYAGYFQETGICGRSSGTPRRCPPTGPDPSLPPASLRGAAPPKHPTPGGSA